MHSISHRLERPGFIQVGRFPSSAVFFPLMHFHLPRVRSFNNLVDHIRDAMHHHKHEKESEAHQV